MAKRKRKKEQEREKGVKIPSKVQKERENLSLTLKVARGVEIIPRGRGLDLIDTADNIPILKSK